MNVFATWKRSSGISSEAIRTMFAHCAISGSVDTPYGISTRPRPTLRWPESWNCGRAAPLAPRVGTPAPRSRNRIATDVSELKQIDSSEPPDPRLHQTRIGDAIAQGKPQMIVFATPRYCTSRVCGPVVDVVRTLIPAYGDRVVFIHEEIWESGSLQKLSPTVEEWNLRSEPWIFVVDGTGTVRARFEGLTTRRELEAALRLVLAPEQR